MSVCSGAAIQKIIPWNGGGGGDKVQLDNHTPRAARAQKIKGDV
jgi:hypothetical protein